MQLVTRLLVDVDADRNCKLQVLKRAAVHVVVPTDTGTNPMFKTSATHRFRCRIFLNSQARDHYRSLLFNEGS